MSRSTVRSREVRIPLFLFVVTTPHHRCSVANMAWDPLASVGRVPTILGFSSVAQTATLHVSLQVCRRLVSMFTAYPLPAEVPIAETYSSHSFSRFVQASYSITGEPWSAVLMEQRAFGGIQCLLRSKGVCVGLMSAYVRMRQKKGFAFAVREAFAGWTGLRTDNVQEKLQVHPCQVTSASLQRTVAPDSFTRG